MKSKAVIAHSGARDRYQVANALYESGNLHKLVTDVIVTEPLSNYIHILRTNNTIPFSKIKMPYKAIFKLAQGLLSEDRLRFSGQIGDILSLSAYQEAKKSNSNLFLYHYDAFYAFKLAIEESFPGQRILFQVHPHPKSIIEILSSEVERVPFARNSILNEFELKFGSDYTERLSSIPEMADRIIVSSGFSKRTLIENGIESSKISVIPYGVDSKAFPFLSKKELNFPLKLLFIGSMIQRKGLADLLLALELIKSDKVQLTICGRGHYDENLLLKFSHLKNVKIKRNLSQRELVNELHNSDVFVLPSLIEGFAHVILEAMSTGLPVITTENTCGPEVIREGVDGWICSIKNPKDIAEKIEWFLEHRNYIPEMSKCASDQSNNFTWRQFKNNIVKFYEAPNSFIK